MTNILSLVLFVYIFFPIALCFHQFRFEFSMFTLSAHNIRNYAQYSKFSLMPAFNKNEYEIFTAVLLITTGVSCLRAFAPGMVNDICRHI